MKLGEIKACDKTCSQCKRSLVNKTHNMCKRCYEQKEINRRTNNANEVERYFIRNNNANTSIRNPGYVDSCKNPKVVRMCYLNPNGFGPDTYEKIQMLIQSKNRMQIDGMFFSSPDRLWNSRRTEQLKTRMFPIGRNIKINTSDTKKKVTNRNGCLPGGTLSVVWDELSDIVTDQVNVDSLGRWSSITIGRESQRIEIITFYRIVDSTGEGQVKVHAQCNEKLGACNSAKHHRQQLLNDLSEHVRRSREQRKIKDFMLVGDMNENVENSRIENFMTSNGLINVHKKINEIGANQMDNAFKIGKHCIDAVMCTCGLIEFIEGCQLTECDEIIMNDHRGFIVDVAIERYCQCRLNAYDKPHHAILNNSKQSHKDLFNEKLIEVMTQYKLKQRVLELKNVDNEQWFNEIDDLITDSLNKARAAVEGPMRSLPYSKKKSNRE